MSGTKLSWSSKLQPIPNTPYLRSENGNIYSRHCLFIQSGPLHAKQISDCLIKILGNTNFAINTVILGERYACKTYVWLDNEEDFEKIMSEEISIPPIELDQDQIKNVPEKELVDGRYFSIVISPTYITPGVPEGKKDNQFFINNVGPSQYSEEMLHCIFDRFAISDKERKAKVTVSNKIGKTDEFWALIEFVSSYDCAFAYRLTHTVTCRDRTGTVYNLLVSYGKVLQNDSIRHRKPYELKNNDRSWSNVKTGNYSNFLRRK